MSVGKDVSGKMFFFLYTVWCRSVPGTCSIIPLAIIFLKILLTW